MSSNWPWAPRTRSNTNPGPDSWSHKKSPFQLDHKLDLNQTGDHHDDDSPPIVNPIPSWLLDDSEYKDLKPTPVMANITTNPMLYPAVNHHHHHHNLNHHNQHAMFQGQQQQQPVSVPNPRNYAPRVRTQSISEELEEARRRLQELQVLQAQSNENAPQTQSAIYEPEVFTAADAQWDAPIQHSSFSAPLSTPFWDRIAAASSEDTSTNNVRDTDTLFDC